MKVCSQVCGVVFDPMEDDFVDVCDHCELNREIQDEEQEPSYYLGACGLIIDYLL